MLKLTPVIFVEEIEPCMGFWIDRLGFEKTIEVPEGDRLGFVAIQRGNVEIMYQSRASLLKDVPALVEKTFARSGNSLYLQVEGIEELVKQLEGVEVVVPERKTWYGAREIGVRAPCGTIVMLSEMTG
jgi:uncharacterized glyoxalase superfamily protein PhnB